MIDTLYAVLLSAGTGIAGGFSGWLFTRKKYNTEVDSNEINNLKDSITIYHTIIEDEKQRIDDLTKRCDRYEEKITELEDSNKQFRDRYLSIIETICIDFTCTQRKRNINLFGNDGISNKKKVQEQ